MTQRNEKIKPSYDENRQVLGKIYPLSTPFTVILDSSEICNFRCNYCFRGQDDKSKWGYAVDNKLMDDDIFHIAVEQIKDFPEMVKTISLSNHGEPLCNRNIPDMVRYIKNQGITSKISIHTNAAMLDEEYAKDLADSNIDRIVISLQGLKEAKYREICKAQINFDEFYHNLEVLYENKKNTQICYKIMDSVLDKDEEEFYRRFSSIGDRVYIEHMVPIWKNVELPMNTKTPVENKYGNRFAKQESCPLIFNTIVVNPLGNVYPCTQLLSPHILGNIKEVSLVKLWNSKEREKLLINQCKGENLELCADCYIRQNSICSEEDMIDDYRNEILNRIYNHKNIL